MTDYLNATYDFHDPRFVAAYDELPLWSAPFGLLLLEYVPMTPGALVLDVGCGTGFPLLQLAGRLGPRARLVGIDPWEAALTRAREKLAIMGIKNVELVCGSGEKMTFPDSTFDLVVSNLGINNFENPARVASECARVLKPGKTLAITTNLVGHMKSFYETYRKVLVGMGKADLVPALDREERHRTTEQDAIRVFEDAGLLHSVTTRAEFFMRYADGTALFNDRFTQFAFLEGWKSVVPEPDRPAVFKRLEAALNEAGPLNLTIPMRYIAMTKPS